MAVCGRGTGRGRGSRRTSVSRPTPPPPGAASGTPRPIRPTPRTYAGCWPRVGCRMLDPAGADPGIPGAAGDLPRPAARAHRLGPADPRGVLPPGRPGAERGSVAHRAGPGRVAGAAATHLSPAAPDDVFTVRTYGDTPQPYGRPASGTFGVSAATGAKVWSGTVGQATNGPVLSGIAIGGGLLVVPAGSTLTAFGN